MDINYYDIISFIFNVLCFFICVVTACYLLGSLLWIGWLVRELIVECRERTRIYYSKEVIAEYKSRNFGSYVWIEQTKETVIDYFMDRNNVFKRRIIVLEHPGLDYCESNEWYEVFKNGEYIRC